MKENLNTRENSAAELLAALLSHGPHIFDRDVTPLKFKRTHVDAFIPRYATDGSACFDLMAVHGGTIAACDAVTFGLGVAFEIPATHVMLLFSRSGHGFKNDVRFSNCVGVIDSDYRGEVCVKLTNDGEEVFVVSPGDRIAQAMLVPLPFVHLVEVDEISKTARGARGFGSTGAH